MRKRLTQGMVLRATRGRQAAGLSALGFFGVGRERQTWKYAMTTVKFATMLSLDLPLFGSMAPYPGTGVWKPALRGDGGYRRLSPTRKDHNK